MKQFITLLIVGMLFAPDAVFAETMYIKEIKISIRSDKELTGSNVVAYVQTGLEVAELKSEGSWSYIRLPDGKEGWVRNQYLVSEKPKFVAVETAQKECEKLLIQADSLSEENKILKEENLKRTSLVTDSGKKFSDLENAYETLKSESKDFLKIQSAYKASVAQRDEERLKAEKMKSEMDKVGKMEKIKFFLSGAGVLFAGFLIGSVSGKQRRKSFY